MVKRALPVGVALALATSSCSEDAYVIGVTCAAIGSCPGGQSGAGGSSALGGNAGEGGSAAEPHLPPGTLWLDLTGSGPERLPATLFGHSATHFLVSTDANANAWTARRGTGFDVVQPNALELPLQWPFADAGSALRHGGAAFSSAGVWADTSQGALVLEVVFRGEPGATLLSQRSDTESLELSVNTAGALVLALEAGDAEVAATSAPLVADAWHHCLVFVDLAEGVAQLFCNGRAGVREPVPSTFQLSVATVPALLGGNAAARVQWSALAAWHASSFGPVDAWGELALERFARLVGSYATGAGEPVPFSDVRPSGAFIDMTSSDSPSERRLHPVGEHWPRIVCRPTADEERACGLLVEASSSQPLAKAAFGLDQWRASAVELGAASAPGPSGEASLFALTPTAELGPHSLELELPFGDGPAVFSLFARAGAAKRLRVEAVGKAAVDFELSPPSVVDAGDALISSAEDWGGGLVRLSFSFAVDAGPGSLRISLLDDAGNANFAGDGRVAHHLGDVELRFRSYSTPLPMLGAIAHADHLVYSTGNGNFPAGAGFGIEAEVWLPAAPLLADAAIVNVNFAGRYQDQLNLFVSPPAATPRFWGIEADAARWQLSSAAALNDARWHRLAAALDDNGAALTVNGASQRAPAQSIDSAALDRIEIGTSTNSSGPLTGMLRRLRITPRLAP